MESAEFSHSRWSRVGAWIGVALILLFFGGFLVFGSVMIISTFVGRGKPYEGDWMKVVPGMVIFMWMCWWAIQHIRYRHSYKARYILDSQGVTVEDGNVRKHVRWESIDSAEYVVPFFYARLKSTVLDRPIIIFLPADRDVPVGEVGRSEFARQLIEVQTGSRFRERWFP